MQLVAVDIGNSSTKIAVEHAAPDDRWSWETIIRGQETIALELSEDPAFWSVSSVNKTRESALAQWVKRHRPNDRFHIIEADDVDLATAVQSRDQLGKDRLIAAWQALQLSDSSPASSAPESSVPLIVIDAGTAVTIDAVTIDAVNAEPLFLGGVIFPGAVTMLQTLARQTDALPDLADPAAAKIELPVRLGFIGQSTEQAILLGVYQTQICTMRAAVKTLSHQLECPPIIYLTGGGMGELLNWLPDDWDHVPDLVLQGAANIGRRLLTENA